MPPGVLNGGVSVDIWQQAEAEAVRVVVGVSEAIDGDWGGGGVEHFPNPVIEFVVGYGGPVLCFLPLKWKFRHKK